MKPLVSICWTTHHEPIWLIKKSLDSLVNQSYDNCEIIIVNDCSIIDGVHEFLEYYATIHKNCLYINLPKNVGYVRAKNIALSAVKGEYIVFMDADYLLQKYFIEYAVKTFEQHDDCFVAWNAQIFTTNNEPYCGMTASNITAHAYTWNLYNPETQETTATGPHFLIGSNLWKADIITEVGYLRNCEYSDFEYAIHTDYKYHSMGMKYYIVEYPEELFHETHRAKILLPEIDFGNHDDLYFKGEHGPSYALGCAQICEFNNQSDASDVSINNHQQSILTEYIYKYINKYYT